MSYGEGRSQEWRGGIVIENVDNMVSKVKSDPTVVIESPILFSSWHMSSYLS